MKPPIHVVVLAVFFLCTARSPAQGQVWIPGADEVEFGVSASVGGVPQQVISVFESGYNGAWYFGGSVSLVAQTFTIYSPMTLHSIGLRLAGLNSQQVVGQFEVSVYSFDSLKGVPAEKLGSVLGNAADYWRIDIQTNVPVAWFDFSPQNIQFDGGKVYAFSIGPSTGFSGGALTVQSARNIYPGGQVYTVSDVPEPATLSLCGLALAACLTSGRIGAKPRRVLNS